MSYNFSPRYRRSNSLSQLSNESITYSPSNDLSLRRDNTQITSSRYSPRSKRVNANRNVSVFAPTQSFDYSPTYSTTDRQVYRPRNILKFDEVYAPSYTDEYSYVPRPVVIDHRDMWHYLAVRQRAIRDIILASII